MAIRRINYERLKANPEAKCQRETLKVVLIIQMNPSARNVSLQCSLSLLRLIDFITKVNFFLPQLLPI
jgi:hypothetical protein